MKIIGRHRKIIRKIQLWKTVTKVNTIGTSNHQIERIRLFNKTFNFNSSKTTLQNDKDILNLATNSAHSTQASLSNQQPLNEPRMSKRTKKSDF